MMRRKSAWRGRVGSGRRAERTRGRNRASATGLQIEPLEPRCVLALEAVPPGFLVDRPLDEIGAIETADEIDAFSLDLNGGQTATVLVEATGGLAPSVTLHAPDHELLASTTESVDGTALLQTIALEGTGTYTILVGGGGTVGAYAVQVLLNTTAELEPFTQTPNDSLETAEDLTSSFIDLAGGVERGAVRGTLPGGLAQDAFGYSAVPVSYEFEDIRATGAVLLQDADDETARLDSAALAGFSFSFYGRTFGTLFVSSNGLITFGSGFDDPLNGDLTAAPAQPAIAPLWDDLDLGSFPEGGEVLWQVRGTGDEQRLIIQWNEIQYFPFFSFFDDPDTITFQVVLHESDGSIQFNYRDLTEAEHFFASEGRSATVGIKGAGEQGGRRLLVAYDSAPNEFVGSQQSVRIGTGLRDGPTETFDLYRFSVEVGRAVTLALDATLEGVLLELLDAAGTRLALGIAADNVAQAINDFIVPGEAGQSATLLARITPPPDTTRPSDYSLLVLRDGVFDTEPNRSAALAQPGTTALGAISSRDRGEVVLLGDFPGVDYTGTDCFCEPPDTHAAVGPNHVVEVVNTAIAVFHKDGSVALPPRELKDFYDDAIVGDDLFDFDPVVAYDDLAERWIVAVLIGATAGAAESDLLYAVSDTSDPTDGFTEQHRIDFGEISPGVFADFPKVGFNADAHVFTLNMFAPDVLGGDFNDVNIVAIDKSTVLDGDPRSFSHFISERPGTSFTMAPASMHTAAPGDPMWLVEEDSFGGGNRVRVVRMQDVLSPNPTYTDFSIPVTAYQFTPAAAQPGGTFRTNDPRISNADLRDGRLVAAHAVGVAGEASVRWYEFDVTGQTPTLAQEGTIDPGPGVHAFFPSIAVNSAGDLGITYMQSSASEFVSMYVTGQVAGSTPGTMSTGVLVRAGEKTYIGGRGGDYSGIGVDPVTDTFWAANEVILQGPSDPLWSTWIGEFTLSDVQDEDWYRVSVLAGDELRLETFTPFDGQLPGANLLDPTITLHFPDGRPIATSDNGAADGRNALLVLTAPESGIYRVQVQGRDESKGTYVLAVGGATGSAEPPAVRDTNPDGGATLGTFPATLQVTFSESVLSTSVDVSDVLIGGLPAVTVSQVDGATFEFTPDPAASAGDGTYEVRIAGGAVLDLQGKPGLAYEASFAVDLTGPRLLQTRWNSAPFPGDRRFAAAPLTFEATLNEALFVLGSARRGLARPGSDDAFVINQATGEIIHPRRVAIDAVHSTFTAEFDALPEGEYTLTLVSGEAAFEDAVGNPLDGEPLGEAPDGTPSGDGAPGGNYTADFVVDRDELVIEELERVAPLGGLVFSSQAEGLLSPARDEDAFMVDLAAGRTVAALVTPHNPAATLTLRLDGNNSIVAGSPGTAVALPASRSPEAGIRRLVVSSDVPTRFDVQIYVNAAVETELTDSTSEQPLPLEVSRLDVGSAGGARYAVVGTSSPQTQETHVFEQSFNEGLGEFTIDNRFGDGGGLWQISGGRRADGDPNHSPPGALYFGQSESSLMGGNYDTGAVTEGAVFSPEIDLPHATRISLTFHHFLQTEDFMGFDVAEVAVVSPTGASPLLSSADGTLPTSTGGGWQTALADLTPFAGQQVRLRFRFDSVDEAANDLEGWFVDDISIVASVVTAPDVDEYSLDLADADSGSLDITLTGLGHANLSSAALQIVSADGAEVLATATIDPAAPRGANYDLAIRSFDPPPEGRVRVRVQSDLSGRYVLLIGQSLAIESEPNALDMGPASLRSLNGVAGALGHLQASDAPYELVVESDPNAFIDISTTGHVLNLSDDGTRSLVSAVGNEFFPAGPLLISNNGVVLAGDDGDVPYLNGHLPSFGAAAALVPFWDDLGDNQGTVLVDTVLVDGSEAFIIQWNDRPHFFSLGTATFQVQILTEGPTPIRYAYRDVDFGDPSLDAGASATIGYQQDATTALEFSVNMAAVAAGDVLSLRWTDPADHYRLDLTAGERRTLSVDVLPSGAGTSQSGLAARLDVLDPTGIIVASATGRTPGGPALVSFVAATDGAYTVRLTPEAGGGEYVLGVTDGLIPGDFNEDGKVDGHDLLNLLVHFGTQFGGARSDGDADGDGDVDRQDVALWRQHVGFSVSEAPSKAVPKDPKLRAKSAAYDDALASEADWLQTELLRNVGRSA